MKQEMLNEINSLYGDIMMAQDDIVYGRLHNKPEVEQQGLAKMEMLMNSTLQHLSYQMDHLKNIEFIKWIKVEDRLPELNTLVLMYWIDAHIIGMGYYCGNDDWIDDNDKEIGSPSHWMPIVPPKED